MTFIPKNENTDDTIESSESVSDSDSESEVESEEEIVEISAEDLKLLKQIRDPETRLETIKALAKAEKLIEEKLAERGDEKPLTQKQANKTMKEVAQEASLCPPA